MMEYEDYMNFMVMPSQMDGHSDTMNYEQMEEFRAEKESAKQAELYFNE